MIPSDMRLFEYAQAMLKISFLRQQQKSKALLSGTDTSNRTEFLRLATCEPERKEEQVQYTLLSKVECVTWEVIFKPRFHL